MYALLFHLPDVLIRDSVNLTAAAIVAASQCCEVHSWISTSLPGIKLQLVVDMTEALWCLQRTPGHVAALL